MISAEFKQNVMSGDLDTVRSALIDDLIIDRTFASFDENLEYAQSKLPIIEPFDNETPFSEEPWDINYLNRQKVALMVNFSIERINHIKKVISNVLPAKDVEKAPISYTSHSSPSSERVGSRTGRTVVSEKPVQSQNTNKTRTSGSTTRPQERSAPAPHNANHSTGGSGRTGSRVIRETVSSSKNTQDKEKFDSDFLSTALIVGGTAVAVVGIATVEPIVIGTGVVVAGTGVGLKVKNRR